MDLKDLQINAMKTQLNDIVNSVAQLQSLGGGAPIPDVVIGGLVSTTGVEAVRTDRIRSGFIDINLASELNTLPTGFYYIIYCYNSSHSFLDMVNPSFTVISSDTLLLSSVSLIPNTRYIRILLKNSSAGTAITDPQLSTAQLIKYSTSLLTTMEDVNTLKTEVSSLTSDLSDALIALNENKTQVKDGLIVSSSNMVARIGYDVYNSSTPPEQSIKSYVLAYKNGYRAFLCDLQITSDGHYVCEHDTNFNGSSHIRNINGTNVTTNIAISDLTLAQLDSNYDFGIYKGSEYAGTKILRLEEIMRLCKSLCCLLVIETKVKCSQAVIEDIAKLAIKYGLQNQIVWAFDYAYDTATDAGYLLNALPSAVVLWRRITATGSSVSSILSIVQAVKTAFPSAKQTVTVLEDGLVNLTESTINNLVALDVDLYFSEITSDTVLTTLINGGYYWLFKYIATRLDTNKYMLEYYGV